MYLTRRLATYDIGDDRHVVFSVLTGDVFIFTDAGLQVLDELARGDARAMDESTERSLVDRRFLFPCSEAEEAHFASVCQTAWDDFVHGAPSHFTFVVNTHCNFACPYCFESEDQRRRTMTLSAEQVRAAFTAIDNTGCRTPDIEIFGGEPLLPAGRPVIEQILAELVAREGHATIQTNGFHLRRHLDLFSAYRGTVGRLQVTLDGPREVHDRRRIPRSGRGTFDRIVDGIEALAAMDLPLHITVRTNVDRGNVAHLAALADLYDARGWTRDKRFSFVAAPVDNRSGSVSTGRLLGWDEVFDAVFPLSRESGAGPFELSVFKVLGAIRATFARQLRNVAAIEPFRPRVNYCEAVAGKLSVFHPDGCIYACPETVGDNDLAIGRYAPRLEYYADRVAMWKHQTIFGRERCHDCPISTLCGGGCPLASLHENGTMAVPACESADRLVAAWFARLRAATTGEHIPTGAS